MLDLKYIKSLGDKLVLNDQGSVELFDFSMANHNDESRVEAATLVSTACYEKDSGFNKQKLYDTFVKKCETPLEFIRTAFSGSDTKSSYRNVKFATDEHQIGAFGSSYGTECIAGHKDTIACFKLRIPLKVVGHLVRHRLFSFMQTSRRYTKVTPRDFYFNKNLYTPTAENHFKESVYLYEQAINDGVKPEDARDLLPAYSLMTTLWMMGNVDALDNLFRVRYYNDIHSGRVMHETKETVKAMIDLIQEYQPTLSSSVTPLEHRGTTDNVVRIVNDKRV